MNTSAPPSASSGTESIPVSTDTPFPGGAPYGAPYDYGAHQDNFGALDPLRLLRIVRGKWRTILLVVLFAGCAAAFYLSKATPMYKSIGMIELSVRRPRILNQQAAVIEDPSVGAQFEQTLNTQLEKLKNRSILASVMTCYRRENADDVMPDDALAERLRSGVSFALLRRTRLVEISFMDRDPVFAARACMAFVGGAEAHARTGNRVASDAAVAWLEAQAKTQRQELEQADQAVFDARQTSRMDVLEGQRKTVQEALLSFNSALVEIESQAARERELLAALDAVDLTPENAGKLPATIPRANEIATALDRWAAAGAEREALLSKYTVQHPEVQARDQAVAIYREQALAALNRGQTTAAANLALFEQQAAGMRRMKDEQSKLASDLERDILDRKMKLAALERTRSAADASYRGILDRIQEARLSADENTATVKLVEGASTPKRPVSPRTARIVLLAIVLGLAGGIGLALVTEMLEDHLVGTDDIEIGSGIKILAVIPHAPTGNRKDIATASLTRRFGEIGEAFASLRAVLDSPAYREQTKVILVASSLPKEGKTTTCCNLAVACARNGQRVLLIDLDLRRPRIAGIFPMPPGQQGLLDYLAGTDTNADALAYSAECPGLSVIGSRGLHDASPSDLVGSRKMAELMAWARANFDRVILDAPPLGIVGDALVLAGLADAVLVMARPSTSRKRALRHTVQRLCDVGVTVIAAVMNDVDIAAFASGAYGPYYHYRKHYRAYLTPEPGEGDAKELPR